MNSGDVGGLIGSGLLTICCTIVPAIIFIGMVVALLTVVKKTKEEEASAKLELQQIISSLPTDKQAAFFVHYNSQAKKPTTAVILAILLGTVGAHKFYLGQTGLGILYLLFAWSGIPTIIGIVEGFTISKTVFQMNKKIAREASALLGGNAALLLD